MTADDAEPTVRCRRYRTLLLRQGRGRGRCVGTRSGAPEGAGVGGGGREKSGVGRCGGTGSGAPGSAGVGGGGRDGNGVGRPEDRGTAGVGGTEGSKESEDDSRQELDGCGAVGEVTEEGRGGKDSSCIRKELKTAYVECDTIDSNRVRSETVAEATRSEDEREAFAKPCEFFRGVLKMCSERDSCSVSDGVG